MDIRVLKYFLAVAKEGSITRAANALHLTQPTLSRQLMDLEEELGKKLLIRGKYRVSLTDEGILLRKRAEEILELVDKTKAEFTSLEGSVSGDIYLGGGETDAIKHIAQITKAIQCRYPSIRLHLYSGNSNDVTERLDKGLLDFGILIQPADLSKYHSIDMPGKDVWGVIMRKDCELARKRSVKVSDLLGLPIICSRQVLKQGLAKNAIVDWFGDDFDKVNIVSTYNLIFNAAILVNEGLGYAFSLDKLVNTGVDSNLCFKPLSPKLESGLNIVWKKNQIFSPAAEIFLREVQAQLSSN